MKKQLNFLIPFIIFLFATSYAYGQLAVNNTATSIEADIVNAEPFTFSLYNDSDNKNVSINNDYEMISVDESRFPFKVSKDFGSYVIPNTNYLKIVASDGKSYSKANLINKNTGDFIFNLNLDMKKNVIDMSNTKPGLYTLTLTNIYGESYKEDIMIM